ncbi:MAG TPA: substrate-binding domain-containing protein [Bryobacteraceae bacterium]|nr:substrate-binding domain-containing protein [Bryobacteraceae bacterium]
MKRKTLIFKKSLLGLSLGAILLPVLGCGGSPHSPEEKYYLIATNIKLPYWQAAGAGLLKAAGQLQVKAEMVGPDTYDAKAEHEEFQSVLSKKPTGILISAADSTSLKPDIDGAIARGIPVITMDSDSPDSKRLFFIGTDNYKAGTMGGKLAAKLLDGKGNVAVYTMPEQANLKDRLRGYKDVFAEHPGIKITDTVDIKGDPRIAFDSTMAMIEKGAKVDAFVCLEAIACPEIADVLDRKNVHGKVVVAMDTDQRTLDWIQKGMIAATIAQKPYAMAAVGLKQLDDLYHHPLAPLDSNWSENPFSPIPSFVDTGATLVDKSNAAAFIAARDSNTGKKGQ